MVKNLPAMQETWVQSLGWEDPLQKVMAIERLSTQDVKRPVEILKIVLSGKW